MTAASAAKWQLRRGRLNHQWLKNRVLSALDGTLQVLRGKVGTEADPRVNLAEQLEDWDLRHAAFARLLEDFDVEMSPAKLVDGDLLPGLCPALREGLGAAVDALWRARLPVDRWLADAAEALEAAREASMPLRDEARSMTPEQFESAVTFLADACRRLGGAVERLPKRIEIT
jgi:hypothetical protein